MLSVKSYDRAYVAKCRGRFATIADTIGRIEVLSTDAETILCNALVPSLDNHFCHRMRGQEGKDGNPLNEVRMLASAIMEHDGVLTEDRTIKYRPEQAVLGIAIGEAVAIDAAGLSQLCDAFLDEIEARF